MTLAEVVADLRRRSQHPGAPEEVNTAFELAASLVETDPDFGLRERVEKLAEECEQAPRKYREEIGHPADSAWVESVHDFARRLREALNPPKKESP